MKEQILGKIKVDVENPQIGLDLESILKNRGKSASIRKLLHSRVQNFIQIAQEKVNVKCYGIVVSFRYDENLTQAWFNLKQKVDTVIQLLASFSSLSRKSINFQSKPKKTFKAS